MGAPSTRITSSVSRHADTDIYFHLSSCPKFVGGLVVVVVAATVSLLAHRGIGRRGG